MTRIAASPFKMWNDIFLTNKERISGLLGEFIETLTTMKRKLETDDLENSFNAASHIRGTIPIQHKGFLKPLSEILVIARDEPGVIARISQTLAVKEINIKDIEVIKIREGEGGTIRLAFDSGENARKAIVELNAHGFSAWERK